MREREGHNQVVTGVDIRIGPIVIFLGMISHDNEENLSHVLFLRQIQGHVAGLAMACLSYLQGISEVSCGKGSQNLDFQNHPKSNGISWYIMVYHGVSLFFPIILPVYHDLSWCIIILPLEFAIPRLDKFLRLKKINTEAPRNAALNSCADARRCLICLPGLPQGILESNYIVTTFQQQAYHGNHGIGP